MCPGIARAVETEKPFNLPGHMPGQCPGIARAGLEIESKNFFVFFQKIVEKKALKTILCA